MSMNFSINTNFHPASFNQSIDDFNKVFNNSLNNQNLNTKIDEQSDFERIFNSMSDKPTQTLSAGVTHFEPFDTIQAQKVEGLETSPVEKMTKDIARGLSDRINELNNSHKTAEKNMETFAAGGDISIHEVMISSQKSALATQMAIQLRNQVVNAYNELRNIQL